MSRDLPERVVWRCGASPEVLAATVPTVPSRRGMAWLEALRGALSSQSPDPLPEWTDAGCAFSEASASAGDHLELLELAAEVDLGPSCASSTPLERLNAAREPGRESRFPHLLRGVEWWLPYRGNFTFRTLDPAGTRRTFGSTYALYRELLQLNLLAWEGNASDFLAWREEGTAAQRAFAALQPLAHRAAMENLMLVGGWR